MEVCVSYPCRLTSNLTEGRCIGRNCFFAKCQQFVFNKTKAVIETNPEVALLMDYNSPNEKIAELIEGHKIGPLKQYNDRKLDTNKTTIYQLTFGGHFATK
jgi:hypothetical protein